MGCQVTNLLNTLDRLNVSIIEFCYFQDTVTNYFNEDRLRRSLKATLRFMGINYYFIRAVYEWPELEDNPTYPVREDGKTPDLI